jgi:hypothetical protein
LTEQQLDIVNSPDPPVFIPACEHNWRLWSREWHTTPISDELTGGWQSTWYCTKCRKIEEILEVPI